MFKNLSLNIGDYPYTCSDNSTRFDCLYDWHIGVKKLHFNPNTVYLLDFYGSIVWFFLHIGANFHLIFIFSGYDKRLFNTISIIHN